MASDGAWRTERIRLGRSVLGVPRLGVGAMTWGSPSGRSRWGPAKLAYGGTAGPEEEQLASPVNLRTPFRAGTGAAFFLDLRHRICYGARGQDGFRDATREEERRRAPHRGEVVPIGSPCEQRRTCWGSERLHFAPGPQPFLTGPA
jgi:hypothetical protein